MAIFGTVKIQLHVSSLKDTDHTKKQLSTNKKLIVIISTS